METASLELCKELYELSGWGWDDIGDRPDDFGPEQWYSDDHTIEFKINWREEDFKPWLPAYTLGYLLRKLPQEVGNKLFILTIGDRPHAGYADRDNYGVTSLYGYYDSAQYADTPEDAVCKLAIELFKQGVLK